MMEWQGKMTSTATTLIATSGEKSKQMICLQRQEIGILRLCTIAQYLSLGDMMALIE